MIEIYKIIHAVEKMDRTLSPLSITLGIWSLAMKLRRSIFKTGKKEEFLYSVYNSLVKFTVKNVVIFIGV